MKNRIFGLQTITTSRSHALLVGTIAVLLANQSSQATTGTWTNPVSGDFWSVTGNWNLGIVANGADAIADFSTLDISADTTVSLDSARTIGSLVFGDAITPSNNWTLDNGGTAANFMTLAGTTKPILAVTNQSASLSLVIAGSNGFMKTGPGQLILNGANTLTGGVLLSDGTLSIGSGGITTATAGTGNISMSNGTTLRLNTSSSAIFVGNNIAITGANANATITSALLSSGYSGNVSGTSDQILTIGDGNVSFSGSNQQLAGFFGSLNIGAGRNLRLSSTGVTANAGNADVGGAKTSFEINGTITARNAFAGIHLGALSGTGALNGGGSTPTGTAAWIIGEKNTDGAFAGTINNGGTSISSLTKLGTGTLTLDGAAAHPYTGVTNVNRGTLLLDFVNLLTPSNLLSGSTTLGLGGGTFSIKGQGTGTTDQTFASASVNAGASSIILNPNGGSATTLNLTAIARAQGGTMNYTTVAGGIVNTTTANANLAGGQQSILGGYATVNGNTWAVSGTGAIPGSIGGLATYSGSLAAALDIDLAAGSNPTGGPLTVNSLRFNDFSAAATVDATGGLLTIATGGILVTSNVGANPTTISGGTLTSGANAGTDLIVIQNNAAAPLSISSGITGARAFTKSGPGTVILTGTNTNSAGTFINDGTLQVGDGTAATVIGGTTNTMNLNGGTLALNLPSITNFTTGNVNISGTSGIRNMAASTDVRVTGAYVNIQGAATLNLSSAGGQLTHAGTESGFTGTIAMTGSAAFTYRFNSSTTNTNLGGVNALYDLGSTVGNTLLNRNGGTTYNLGGLQGGSGALLKGASDAAGTASTYSIGALGTNTTFDGRIQDGSGVAATISILKVGTGNLTLNNVLSTYTGTTTVSAGGLIAGADVAVSASSPLGNAAGDIVLGNAATTTNNSNPSLLTGGAVTVSRGVTIANQSTTGVYTIGGNTSNPSTFSGLVTVNKSLVISQISGGTLNVIGGITSANAGVKTVTFTGPGAVNVSTTAISDGGTGSLGVVANGGTLTLSSVNNYTGATTVNAGTLNIAGSITSAVTVNSTGTLSGAGSVAGNVQVAAGGRLASVIAATPAAQLPLVITGTLTVDSGNILALTAAATPAAGIYKLATTTGGVTYAAGTVNLTGVAGTVSVSGNDLILTVAGGGSAYAAWASTHAGSQTANLDFDNDGVSNGVEYFLNSPAGFTANPGLSGGTVTWINGGNIPSSAYGTQFVVQSSPDLVNWTNVPLGGVVNTSGSVSYALTGSGKSFARLLVTPN